MGTCSFHNFMTVLLTELLVSTGWQKKEKKEKKIKQNKTLDLESDDLGSTHTKLVTLGRLLFLSALKFLKWYVNITPVKVK